MALPVHQSISTIAVNASNADALTLNMPAGIVAGDALLAFVGTEDSTTGATLSTATTGWTKVGEAGTATADAHCAVWWKEAVGSDAAPVIDYANTTRGAGWVTRVTGADIAALINVSNFSETGGTASSHAITGVTTDTDDCLVYYFLAFDGGDGLPFSVTGTGFAEIAEGQSNTSGNADVAVCIGSRDLATLGASGTATVACNATDGASWFQIAIKPTNDVNVVSGFETLSLTKYDTALNVKKELTSGFASLTLTAYESVVKTLVNVVSDFDTLSLTPYATIVNAYVDSNVVSDFDSLTLIGYNAIVNAKKYILSDFDTLALTSYDSSARITVNVVSDFDTLALTGYESVVAVVDRRNEITSDFDTLTFTVHPSLINVKKDVTSDFDTLSLTAYDSTVLLTHSVLSDFATLTFTEHPSLINVKKEVVSNFETLTLTPYTGVLTGNYAKRITSDYQTLTLTAYQSSAKLIIPGIFEISGQMIFKGNWTINET
jgi:hypothetical protein